MKLFRKVNPPKTVCELKIARDKIWNNFPQVQLTKLSRVLETA